MNYQELKSRHQELESIVDQAYKNYVSDEIIKRYKKEKLKIKELIDRFEHSWQWSKKITGQGRFFYNTEDA